MPQSGYTPIQIYSSSTPTNAPSAGNLTNDTKGSELAINIADGKLFYKDSSNVVQTLADKSWTGTVTSVAALTIGTTGTDLSSTVANSTTTPVITLNVPTASASNRGALSSTDWSTFNAKQAAYTNLTTFGSLANATGWLYNNGSGTLSYSTPSASDVGAVPTSRTISTTAPLAGGGALSGNLTLSIPAATSSANGYLTSTDWSTFNGKQAALVSGTNIKTVNGTTLLGSGDLGTIGVGYGGTGASSASITAFNNITGYTASGATGTTSTNLVFSTSPTMTTPKATSTIGVGNATPAASGAGITFPGSASDSSDVNTLDDYEEGTWTPALTSDGGSSGQSYSNQVGKYTKIGNIVYYSFYVSFTAKGSNVNEANLSGFPFAITSSIANGMGYVQQWGNLSSNFIWFSMNYKGTGTATYITTMSAASTGTSYLLSSSYTDTFFMRGGGFYYI